MNNFHCSSIFNSEMVILTLVTTTPPQMCPSNDDEFLPPSTVFITNEPDALQGGPGADVPADQDTMIEATPAGSPFTVMELTFQVNPVTDGDVTVVFETLNGPISMTFQVSMNEFNLK